MTQGDVLSIFSQSLLVALKLAGPMLLASIVIGLIVAIFQAATQIQEQTLTFVPKILAIALLLFITGSAMMTTLGEFMVYLFDLSARI
jgi:flagellar biosynthetic protein FliQ